MADINVRVIIEAVDKATSNINSVGNSIDKLSNLGKNLTGSMGQSNDALSQLTNGFVKGQLAVDLFYKGLELTKKGIGFLYDAAMAASKINQLELAMYAVGKATKHSKDEIDKTVESLEKLGVAKLESRQATVKLMQSEIDLSDAGKLARVSQDLAAIAQRGFGESAMSSSEAFDTLTQAISAQSPMLLRQFGIVKTTDQIFEEYAATLGKSSNAMVVNTAGTAKNEAQLAKLQGQLHVAQLRMGEFTDKTKESTKAASQMKVDELSAKIAALTGNTTAYSSAAGKTSDSLTALEKRQAFLNAILTEGQKVTGVYEESMKSAYKIMGTITSRTIPDMITAIGQALNPLLETGTKTLYDWLTSIKKWFEDNKVELQSFGEEVVTWFEKMSKSIEPLMKSLDNLALAFENVGTEAEESKPKYGAFQQGLDIMVAGINTLIYISTIAILSLRMLGEMILAVGEALTGNMQGFEEHNTKFNELMENMGTATWNWASSVEGAAQRARDAAILSTQEMNKGVTKNYGDMMSKVDTSMSNGYQSVDKYSTGMSSVATTQATITNTGVKTSYKNMYEEVNESLLGSLSSVDKNSKAMMTTATTKASETNIGVSKDFLSVSTNIISSSNEVNKQLPNIWNSIGNTIVNTAQSIINWVGQAIGKIQELINKKNESNNIKSDGSSWQKAGEIPGVRGTPQLATVHAGERIVPAVGSSSGGVNLTFNFSGTFLGSQNEMRNYSMQIWEYINQVAKSQNKSPYELLN